MDKVRLSFYSKYPEAKSRQSGTSEKWAGSQFTDNYSILENSENGAGAKKECCYGNWYQFGDWFERRHPVWYSRNYAKQDTAQCISK